MVSVSWVLLAMPQTGVGCARTHVAGAQGNPGTRMRRLIWE